MDLNNLFRSSPHRRLRTDSFEKENMYRGDDNRPLNLPEDAPWLGETDENYVYKWVPVSDPSERGYTPQVNHHSMARKGYFPVKSIEFPHLSYLSKDMRTALNTIDRERGTNRERDVTSEELYIYNNNEILMKIEREKYDYEANKNKRFAQAVNDLTTPEGFNAAHKNDKDPLELKISESNRVNNVYNQ